MDFIDEQDNSIHTDLLDSLPDAVAWLKPVFDSQGQLVDFRFTYCNQMVHEMIGRGLKTQTGTLLLADNQENRSFATLLYTQYAEVYTTGQTREYSYLNPITNAYLNVIRQKWKGGVLGITRDRTNEKLAEEKAELTRQKYTDQLQFVTDSALTAIGLYSIVRDEQTNEVIDLRYELINQMAERMTGRKARELVGHTMREVFEGIELSGIWAQYKRLAETGEPLRFHNHYHFDGYDLWYEVQGIRKDNYIVLSFLDISELKRSQQEKQRQANLLNSILATSPVGIALHQAVRNEDGQLIDLRYEIVNEAAAQIAGFSVNEMLQKSVLTLYPAMVQSPLYERYIQVIETGEPLLMERVINNRWYQVSSVKFDDGFISAIIDINQGHEAREQLEEANKELRRSNQSLQQFAYVASHDLQEPLRKIQSFGDLLVSQYESSLGENGQDLIRRMQSASARMAVLINDLLTYSRITTHREPFQTVNLSKLLIDVQEDLDLTIRETRANIQIDPMPIITGDPSQLRQLFQNLLGNSIKFRKQGVIPTIHIYCQQVQGTALPAILKPTSKLFYDIQVTDNGIGFDPKYGDRIFEVFQRLHNKQQYAGTGVGLSICKRVAENHGGTITVESQPDRGATFHVFLPA